MARDRELDLTAEEMRAREALRTLPPPRAEAAFRERLKAEFTSGTIAEPEARTGAVSGAPDRGRAGARVASFPRARGRGFFGRPWAWIPSAAAAAAAVVFAVNLLNTASDWDAVRVSGAKTVNVDGKAVPLEANDEFCKHLTPGARLSVPQGAEVSLICGNQIGLVVRGGSTVSMPAPPGRWFSRTIEMRVHEGEVHITTGRAFQGARLAVLTPEARAEVTGTTLAVICQPGATCVCVYEGAVNVAPLGAAGAMVQGGLRGIVGRDSRAPEIVTIRDDERAMLSKYRDEMRAKLE